MSQISPYVDNELMPEENFEFRKYLMKSKNAQKELKNTYIMQKHIKYAYNNTLKKAPTEITRNVMNKINQTNNIFESVILQQIFTMKTAKIAILAGLVFIGAYEYSQFNAPLKPKIEHTIEQILDKNSPDDEPFIEDYQSQNTEINR